MSDKFIYAMQRRLARASQQHGVLPACRQVVSQATKLLRKGPRQLQFCQMHFSPKPRLCELQEDVSVPGQRVGPRVACARHRAVRHRARRQQTADRTRGPPCAPRTCLLMASFTSDRRCSRASISSPLALTTWDALRQPTAPRARARHSAATPGRRCPQPAHFFRSLEVPQVWASVATPRTDCARSTHPASRSWPGDCRPRPPASVPGLCVSTGAAHDSAGGNQAHLLAKHIPQPRSRAAGSASRGCSRRKPAQTASYKRRGAQGEMVSSRGANAPCTLARGQGSPRPSLSRSVVQQ